VKKVIGFILFSLLLTLPSFATLTNLTVDNSKAWQPSDSLKYSYESNKDSVWTYFFRDASDNGTLDTSKDILIYRILQVDNGSASAQTDSWGLFPDANSITGQFAFTSGANNLAPGLYWLALSDGESSMADTFRIEALANPFRTISGKLIATDTVSIKYRSVSAETKNSRFSAYTDTNGNYTICLDTQTVNQGSQFQVRVDNSSLGAYTIMPNDTLVDVGVESATGVNFKLLKATSGFHILCTMNGKPLAGIGIGANDTTTHSNVGGNRTDNLGQLTINCPPGGYEVNVNRNDLPANAMSAKGQRASVTADTYTDLTFVVPVADTVVRGTIKKNGITPPGGKWEVRLYNKENSRTSETISLPDGSFALPASTLDSEYFVRINNNNGNPDVDTIPAGYMIEGGDYSRIVKLGNTVTFNFIPKPTGSISGTIADSTSLSSTRLRLELMTLDTTNSQMQPTSIYWESDKEGAFTLNAVPAGTYALRAFLGLGSFPGINWKIVKIISDSFGEPIPIIVKNSAVSGLELLFVNSDTLPFVPKLGAIEGRVKDELLRVNKQTQIYYDRLNKGGSEVKSANDSGDYRFDALQFGKYRVYALLDTNSDGSFDLRSQDTVVEVTNSLSYRADLVLHPRIIGTDSISGTVSATFPLPTSTNIMVTAIPVDTNLPPSGRTSAGAMAQATTCHLTKPGAYTLYGLNLGVYYVTTKADSSTGETSRETFADGFYQRIIDGLFSFKLVILDGEKADSINMELLLRKVIPVNKISGKVEYTGRFPVKNINILFIDSVSDKPVRTQFVDDKGQFSLTDLPNGAFFLRAVIDSANDQNPEALGMLDSTLHLSGNTNIANLTIKVLEKPKGTGSITGTLSCAHSLPPRSTVRLFAVPVDTLLSDSANMVNAAKTLSYNVKLTELGTYAIAGLADTTYMIYATIDTGVDKNEQQWAIGIFGTLTSLETPMNEWVFTHPVIAGGNTVSAVDITLLEMYKDNGREEDSVVLPTVFALSEPSPNPANPVVRFSYSVPVRAAVNIAIFDVTGRMIKSLVNRTIEPGFQKVIWDAKNTNGQQMASGIYICRMQSKNFISQKKLILLK